VALPPATLTELFLAAVSAALGAALLRLRWRERQALESFRQLDNVAHSLAEADDLPAIAARAHEAVATLAPIRNFKIDLFDENDRVREVWAPPEGRPDAEPVRVDRHPDLDAAVDAERLDVLAATETAHSFAPRDLQAARLPRRRFRLPLFSGKRLVGYWELEFASPLSPAGATQLAAIYRHVTNAVAAEKHFRLAARDSLTDLFVRRFFDGRLAEEVLRSQRYERDCAVAQFDLDHFKALNDRHGHAAGDEALRLFSRLLKQSVRQQDVCGRRGGEEFAVLFPETDRETARRACERIRQSVAASPLVLGGAEVRLTVSAGVAGLEAGDDRDRLLARADAALYRAKEAGRNRVIVAEVST
jgi:diguanylate cyclase (GGDEF)-like protein